MEKKVFLSNESLLQFSNALELLYASINEFNQLADKIVPEKLLTDGVLKYLKYFCKLLEEESNIRVNVDCYEDRLEAGEEVEISLFRSIRTLVMMLVKNSRPLNIDLHLRKTNQKLNIHITDDGKNILKQPVYLVHQALDNVDSILKSVGGKIKPYTAGEAGNRLEIEIEL